MDERVTLAQILIGRSNAIQAVRDTIERVAAARHTILIQGETGTGKELVAQALHRYSDRPGRFVDINISAITETLFESELFGYVNGAFSGATRTRAGLIRSAHRGTLFLDEIGELALGSQVKLLRVIERREVLPVGSDTLYPVDVRIVAATNANLHALVARKSFRADLLARLLGGVITLPPLRHRLEDVPMLAEYFVQHLGVEYGRPVLTLTEGAIATLCTYAWPGNVRQLRQLLEDVIVQTKQSVLTRRDIEQSWHRRVSDLEVPVRDSVYQRLIIALGEYPGDILAAAKSLGMSRATIYRLIRKYGIATQPRVRSSARHLKQATGDVSQDMRQLS